ncbi:CDP-glycerol glycerophosphotransferase family protein [Streptomyces sp. 549]|uniref:bifunctional glycosyltransferase/CDP-glycerol:glycerophosphate glycerophosphotransferase n=1 Tax=Streptomyces sp. 549 TaxID=3049076 RepID=UPI0024C3D98E|nr:bifunctional glycosyltransferase/CDP-glycerol:glycerophosphate glycerophosphotransferase [Streptomyces sp. 549]MDK1473877.1 CDP-glycerol glycerophosphotransferase family protein [Streptomyces sp. 549]
MALRLSAVVPLYNVETYLEECLESLAAQTLRDIEVVMVDDGSTDGSAEIAAEFAARDERFRLVRQSNGGLGHARNTGVRHCSPEADYLTFVDSDDIIPDYAYALCVRTLDETGSDLLSGNVLLLRSTGTEQSPMHRRAMATTRLRTHITRDESLIYDRLAPNKVFRRDFWDRHDMAFPEGVLYEDIPLTLPAHFRAGTVDILSEPVYYWRQRDGGGPSITQRRTELNAVRDRVAAVDSVSRFLAERPGRENARYKRWYDKSALGSDIRIFINVLPEADQEFRELFMEVAGDFLSRVDPRVTDTLPALMRLKWHLIREGRLEELLEVLAYEKRGIRGIPVVRRFRRYARYPYFGDRELAVPKKVYRLGQELSLRSKVSDIRWDGDRLRVTGYSYVNHLNVHKRRMSRKVIGLRNSRTRRTLVVPARTTYAPQATAESGQARYSYDWAGFEFTLDARRLRSRGEWTEGTWRFAIGNLSRGLLRRGALNPGPFGTGSHPPVHYVSDRVRLVPLFVRGRLRLKVERIRARFLSHRFVGDALELRLAHHGELPEGSTLRLRHVRHLLEHEYPLETEKATADRTVVVARVPLADLTAVRDRAGTLVSLRAPESETWRPDLVVPHAGAAGVRHDEVGDAERAAARPAAPEDGPAVDIVPVAVDNDTRTEGGHLLPAADGQARELALHRNAPGHLLISDRIVRPLVDEVSWQADGTLVLGGTYPGDSDVPVALVLRHRAHHELKQVPLTRTGDRFTARVTPAAFVSQAGTLPLRPGRWNLVFQSAGAAPDADAAPVQLADHLVDDFPVTRVINERTYTAQCYSYDRLALEVLSALKPDERGPYRQKQLRTTVYPQARNQPLRDAVLYDSYTGKQFSDSPRAVFEELRRRGSDLEHLWVVRDEQVELPEGARAVRMWGREWFEAMARCRYVVTNAHLPHWIRRRPGQVIVQAWHGTPLKKIGHDIEDVQFANSRYLENVAQESRSWSFLVSPNRFSTPILKRAFAFDGELLEAGYPRNDILHAADRDEMAKRVRERIGLPPDKKVVLYAPTWRDDQFYGPGRYKLDLRVDLDAARKQLGEDHVLLVRRHPNVVDTVPGEGDGFVWDVSEYPEIGELFLVADVLVTDYSSLMFDFAGTGRPILFFTYDLEHYRDQLRGFYFDFEREAPGPLLSTSQELVAALRDIDAVSEKYREEYRAFQHTFCDLDDGGAAGRVIDRMTELAAAEDDRGVD